MTSEKRAQKFHTDDAFIGYYSDLSSASLMTSLMTRHNPDLGSASDWLKQIFHVARPNRSTTQIWVVTRHQYGISTLVSQTSFRGEARGGVAKCRLFSQAILTQGL